MARALLGLGSNMGDSWSILREAVGSLSGVVAISPVYRTDAVGGPAGQDAFLNIIVEIDTDLTARQLLGVCHRLESAADRVRTVRWGPRTLDVDIVWIDGVTVAEPDLQVPHPRMRQRRFVMAPLADVAPDVAGPDWRDGAEGRVDLVGPLDSRPG
jgi:2-amino-4-hydroxy-6-hydroxymethyldihydropteridine diphosphokinase